MQERGLAASFHRRFDAGGRCGCDSRLFGRSRSSGLFWGPRRSQKNGIGRSKGGCTTKIHALTDVHGKPIRLTITPGQQHDSTVVTDFLDFVKAPHFLADKAYDTNEILSECRLRDIQAVIPSTKRRKKKRRINKAMYAKRYIVECFFHDLKRFRRIATRFEKTAGNFAGMIHFAAIIIAIS